VRHAITGDLRQRQGIQPRGLEGSVEAGLAGAFADLFVVGQGAFAILEILLGEQEGRFAEENLVGVYQARGLGNAAAVDEDAVLAVHVFRKVLAAILIKLDTEVLARHQVAQQLQGAGSRPGQSHSCGARGEGILLSARLM